MKRIIISVLIVLISAAWLSTMLHGEKLGALRIAPVTDVNWNHGFNRINSIVLVYERELAGDISWLQGKQLRIQDKTVEIQQAVKSGTTIELWYKGEPVTKPKAFPKAVHLTESYFQHVARPFLVTFLFFLIAGVLIVLATYIRPEIAVITAVLILGLIGVARFTIYSGADEAAHFDYINYLVTYRQLPTLDRDINPNELLAVRDSKIETIPFTKNHQAVHPPVYYVTSAVLSTILHQFDERITLRLYMLRAMGVFVLALTTYIAFQLYRLLAKNTIIPKNILLFTAIFSLFVLSPRFLTIMVPLNNDHFLLLFLSTLLYVIVLTEIQTMFSFKRLILIAVLSALCVLSKFTSIYLLPLLFLYMFRFNIKYALQYATITGLIILPWIIHNLRIYGAITGIKQHLAIAVSQINPGEEQFTLYDVWRALPDFLQHTWFSRGTEPQELFLSVALSAILWISFIWVAYQAFKDRNERPLFTRITMIFLVLIAANLATIIQVSLSTGVFALIGRYTFMNLLPFAFIMYMGVVSLFKKQSLSFITGVLSVALIVMVYSHFYPLVLR